MALTEHEHRLIESAIQRVRVAHEGIAVLMHGPPYQKADSDRLYEDLTSGIRGLRKIVNDLCHVDNTPSNLVRL
jgi:hypothetical protein